MRTHATDALLRDDERMPRSAWVDAVGSTGDVAGPNDDEACEIATGSSERRHVAEINSLIEGLRVQHQYDWAMLAARAAIRTCHLAVLA